MKKGIRISKKKRNRIRADYILLNLSLGDLAAKHNLHRNTVSKLVKNNNWPELRHFIKSLPYYRRFIQGLLSLLQNYMEKSTEDSACEHFLKEETRENVQVQPDRGCSNASKSGKQCSNAHTQQDNGFIWPFD